MMAGAGLDARIVHELDLDLKRKIGKLSYWHGGLMPAIGRHFEGAFASWSMASSASHACALFAPRRESAAAASRIAWNVRSDGLTTLKSSVFEAAAGWQDYVRFFSGVPINRPGSMRRRRHRARQQRRAESGFRHAGCAYKADGRRSSG